MINYFYEKFDKINTKDIQNYLEYKSLTQEIESLKEHLDKAPPSKNF